MHEAGVWPWLDARPVVRIVAGWLETLFRAAAFGEGSRSPVRLVNRRDHEQLLRLELGADGGFTYDTSRGTGKSEMMRVVAMDRARREITFTADAVAERPLPPRSRVPAGLQKHRLDGRRQR